MLPRTSDDYLRIDDFIFYILYKKLGIIAASDYVKIDIWGAYRKANAKFFKNRIELNRGEKEKKYD